MKMGNGTVTECDDVLKLWTRSNFVAQSSKYAYKMTLRMIHVKLYR